MQLKAGVQIHTLEPQTLLAMMIVESLHLKLNLPEFVITSVNEGDHMDGSLHYLGKAFDVRTKTMRADQIDILFRGIKDSLGTGLFDVIKEGDHIHVEYDPKPVKV